MQDLNYSKKDLGGGKVEVQIEVGGKRFNEAKEKVFKQLSKNVSIPGFRPGKAPQAMVEAQLGPDLYERTLNTLLPQCTVEALDQEKLSPIDRVEYKILHTDPAGGVTYTATFSVLPEVKFGDFSKIKVEKEEVRVTDEEIEKVISQMFEDWKRKQEQQLKKKGEKKTLPDKPTDEWAKQLGMEAKSLEELKEQVKKQLTAQKQMMSEESYRAKVIEEAVKLSEIQAPETLVERELDRRQRNYESRIKNLGLNINEFLKSQKTTFDKLREGWKEEAKKFVESELLLMQIAKEHKIEIADSEVEKEIEKVTDPKVKKQYESDSAKDYIRQVMLRQKSMEWLLGEVKVKSEK